MQSKRPLFQSWRITYKKIEKFIDNLHSNFDNSKEVEKKFLKFGGFTQKGLEVFNEAQKTVK